jgi:hypothetical protein
MFRTKQQSRTEAARDHARAAAADLGLAAGELISTFRETAAAVSASDVASKAKSRAYAAKEVATPAIQEAADAARERLQAAAASARDAADEALHEAADRTRPTVEAAQATLVESVVPKVSAALVTAAAALAAGAEQAREVAGPHLEQAKETAAVGGHRAHGAYSVLRGDAVAKKRGGKGRWLLAVGLTAATVAAVAAFRKQKQAEDPWATPLDSRPEGSTLKDKATEQVGHAKEVVVEAASKAKDKATDLAAKGQAAIADAKDRSGEALDPASDEVAAADATTADVGATDPVLGGQVTAVGSQLDSDAISSDAVEGGTINGASTTDSSRGSAQTRAERGDDAGS